MLTVVVMTITVIPSCDVVTVRASDVVAIDVATAAATVRTVVAKKFLKWWFLFLAVVGVAIIGTH